MATRKDGELHSTVVVLQVEMQALNSVALWPMVLLVVLATITDLSSRQIPNVLVLPFLLVGVGASALWRGWSGVGQSLLGVLLAVTALGLFWVVGGLGAGDMKLCAAIGAWLGPSQLCVALVLTSLVGGVIALGWAIAGGFLGEAMRDSAALMCGRRRGRNLASAGVRKMPYAPAIAIGTLLSFVGRHI